jgi:glycine cleavage system H protein
MKEMDELVLPEDLRYSRSHEWAKVDGDRVRVGINDYAQSQLGDIVFVELPGVGDRFEKGQEFGTVESVKAVAEVYLPVGGEVTAVNDALSDAPEIVNKDPYGQGWFLELAPDDPAEADALLDRGAYLENLKEQE